MAKVLISAYSCCPGEGSEPGIGWNQVLQAARRDEVWVITRSNNRAQIDRAIAISPLPNVHWVYFDLPSWVLAFKKGPPTMRIYYLCWQFGAYLEIRKLHQRVGFDLLHHVTWGNYWMVVFLPLLPVPFVWGPVGGGESAPRDLRRSLTVRNRISETLRDCARKIGEINPIVRLTARRSILALATTEETAQRLRAIGCRNTSVLLAVGLPAEELERLAAIPAPQGDKFRVVSLGRLLYWKGIDLGLFAFARFHQTYPNSEYSIMGDGPERVRLERLAVSLGIRDKVVFHGVLPRDEVFRKWEEGHVLLFPSLHDSGGFVSLEAMAAGRPVVCLDTGGPGLQVNSDTGIKIRPAHREQVVEGLAEALGVLANDRDQCTEMGYAGRERAREHFNWDKKGNLIHGRVQVALGTRTTNGGKALIRHELSGKVLTKFGEQKPGKVLVSAYACEPTKGSEPSVGWNQVREVSRSHQVWVITRSNNQRPIEAALKLNPMPAVHWVYFDFPCWVSIWKRGPATMRIYYHLWQFGAYLKARKLHKAVGFDLAHHVTWVNYWMMIFLALLPVPFIWGPVGGGESTPRKLRRALSLRGRIYEGLRDAGRKLGEINPIVRLTARRAVIALAATEETGQRLKALGCKNVVVFSQVALPQDELGQLLKLPPPRSHQGPFRVLGLGRLLHLKGFDFAMKAFARFHSGFPDSEYWIVGDGPEGRRLRKMAKWLGLENSVKFWGTLPRAKVFEILGKCDTLLFPCLHDSGGWACAEAMAAGRPVICLDLGGPALQVTSNTGIKIPAIHPEQVVTDLSAALSELALDTPRLLSLGQRSRERVVKEFSWEQKGKELSSIYFDIATPGNLARVTVASKN
jgi:glycosyltransferase involved in cell wall biosynthesis